MSDVFKAHRTDKAKDLVCESNKKMVLVPSNWTNYFQFLGLTVKKSTKDFLQEQAQF